MAPKIRVLVAMVSALTERGAHLVADARAGSPAHRHQRAVGPNALCVMLSGMSIGSDAARVMRQTHNAGSWNVAQDEASCVVHGMPRAAIAASAQPSPAR